MKSVAKLEQKLNKLNLSDARKTDLVTKYVKADARLTKQMNNYFGIQPPAQQKKATKTPKPKRKASQKQQSRTQYSKTNKQTYRGSNASVFDHRARPEPDLHLEEDKLLDREYFKNS